LSFKSFVSLLSEAGAEWFVVSHKLSVTGLSGESTGKEMSDVSEDVLLLAVDLSGVELSDFEAWLSPFLAPLPEQATVKSNNATVRKIETNLFIKPPPLISTVGIAFFKIT